MACIVSAIRSGEFTEGWIKTSGLFWSFFWFVFQKYWKKKTCAMHTEYLSANYNWSAHASCDRQIRKCFGCVEKIEDIVHSRAKINILSWVWGALRTSAINTAMSAVRLQSLDCLLGDCLPPSLATGKRTTNPSMELHPITDLLYKSEYPLHPPNT